MSTKKIRVTSKSAKAATNVEAFLEEACARQLNGDERAGESEQRRASELALDLWSNDVESLTAAILEENQAFSETKLRSLLNTLSRLRRGLIDLSEQAGNWAIEAEKGGAR